MKRFLLEYRGGSIELPEGEILLGRGLSCRIRFNDSTVSRHHVLFKLADDQVTVEDLGSKNGSRINGEPLSGVRALQDQDVVQMGNRWLRLCIMEVDHFSDDVPTAPEMVEDEELWTPMPPQQEAAEPGLPALPGSKASVIGLPPPARNTCPRCRATVPFHLEKCSSCGYRWPPGRPLGATQRIDLKDRLQALPKPRQPLERRTEARRPIEVPVIYRSDILTFDAVARDLSSGGIFIASELLDKVGTECTITVLPDGKAAIHIPGVVCHVITSEGGRSRRPPGMGIRFIKMSEEAKAWSRDELQARRFPRNR